jgi:hypothetical protein
MANPNATNPVSRPSGDRNEPPASKSENAKEDRRRQKDLTRQAKGAKVSGPDSSPS